MYVTTTYIFDVAFYQISLFNCFLQCCSPRIIMKLPLMLCLGCSLFHFPKVPGTSLYHCTCHPALQSRVSPKGKFSSIRSESYSAFYPHEWDIICTESMRCFLSLDYSTFSITKLLENNIRKFSISYSREHTCSPAFFPSYSPTVAFRFIGLYITFSSWPSKKWIEF